MRAVHIVAGLDPSHGGPSYSVPRLCRALRDAGIEVELLSVAAKGAQPEAIETEGLTTRLFGWDHADLPIARDLRLSRGLAAALDAAAAQSDIVHDHGLWLFPNLAAGRAAGRAGRPLIVTPRGMLGAPALAFSPVRKRLFWRLLQKPAFAQAACYHATAESERAEIRAFGIRAPVAVIPNGVDMVAMARTPRSETRTMVYLGRLHPMKALRNLLEAWRIAAPSDWRLRLVGPDEAGHGQDLAAFAREAGLDSVSIEPPVYGEEKTRLLAGAAVTILPSHNENFGIVAAESLAAGTPVIASTGTPWSGLARERCGWWVGNDPASLAQAIAEAGALPDEALVEMGARGRAWIAREYGWDAIGEKMARLYEWVAGRGDRPEFVSLD